MLDMILLGIALYMLQVWFIPLGLELITPGGIKFLFGNRSEPFKAPEYINRISTAGANIKESMAIFLALSILSIVLKVDNSSLALGWLISRVAHYLIYCVGIPYIRTVAWLISVIFLIMMVMSFII